MCWYCGNPIIHPEPIGRSAKCPDCSKDLRSCRNCSHLRPSGCAESSAEKPSDTDRANFCDWFSLNPKFREKTAGEEKSIKESASAKKAFDNLFN